MHDFNVVRAFHLLSERRELINDFKTPPLKQDKEDLHSRNSMWMKPTCPKHMIPGAIENIEVELSFLGVVFEPVDLESVEVAHAED